MIDNPLINDNLDATVETLHRVDRKPIDKVVKILQNARENGNTVYTFGNGGSHSNASHFANDLLKACGLKAICISDMIPTILAYMNDDGERCMFDSVISPFMDKHDVFIAFSCSGNSENVYYPLVGRFEYHQVLFTGDDGGMAIQYASIAIKVPHPDIKIQESCHSAICHAIVHALNGGV